MYLPNHRKDICMIASYSENAHWETSRHNLQQNKHPKIKFTMEHSSND